ncbi:hypothetical protein P3X46_014480 [Hevea brasiliensis]|uniref:APO domain-containing protein n=1 Tax=Hevea brasiliensis TaxID=3981 RepID=A0ABQ9M993_HEVBR|nr:hypothetical protein P3X46_014480 [Hevea brasiliensis]
MIGKKVIDRGGYVEEPTPWHTANPSTLTDFDTHRAREGFSPPLLEDVPKVAQETIDAYETVGWDVRKLMRKYTVKARGYCSEVHVGPWGHNVELYGEYKHQ